MTNYFDRHQEDVKSLGRAARNLRATLNNEKSFDELMRSCFLRVGGYIHKALDDYLFVKEDIVPSGNFDSVQAKIDYHNFRRNHAFLALQEGANFSERALMYNSALNALENSGRVPDGLKRELDLFLKEVEMAYEDR